MSKKLFDKLFHSGYFEPRKTPWTEEEKKNARAIGLIEASSFTFDDEELDGFDFHLEL